MKLKMELFFNTGDLGKQCNFIIRPNNMLSKDLEMILYEMDRTYEKEYYRSQGFLLFSRLEKYLNEKKISPDPTKYKLCSDWFYAQFPIGAIIYRFSYDGRRETDTGRINSSIEGAFLRNYNLDSAVKKYGINVIENIGSFFPQNIEKLLVNKNKDVFLQTRESLLKSGSNRNLFNAFYVDCWGKEINLCKDVELEYDIPLLNFISKMNYSKR